MNFAIVGAGLLGRLLAWRLLEAGHQVSLYDKDVKSGDLSAAVVAAAMLAPVTEVLDAEAEVYQFGVAGFDIWKIWASELQAVTGIDISLQLNGSLLVSHRNDQGDYQRCLQRIQAHNAVNQRLVANLDKVALAELEPELAENFDRGFFLQEEGCLDNLALLQALQKRIEELGATWFEKTEVAHLSDAVLAADFTDFDKVLDCRGVASKVDVKDLRGVRGEVIRVYAPEVKLSRPVRLMHPRYKLYIAPKPHGEYVIGATQIESESEHPLTVRSSLELLSALYSVHKGFAEAEIMTQYARCRPAFSDNLPRIEVRDKLMHINGLYRHGYLLSPVLVQETLAVLGLATSQWPEIVKNNISAQDREQGVTA